MVDISQPVDAVEDRFLTIGALARLTKTNPSIIRKYEDLGLLPPPQRPGPSARSEAGGHRVYGEPDVRRLVFLRRARDLGVLNPNLGLLIELVDTPAHASQEAQNFACQLLGNVQDQLNDLSGLEKTLEALLAGAGEQALALTKITAPSGNDVKRMRRQLRKPLKTPAGN
jgi:DNA-binding transcriptional MerR regulator